MSLSKLFTLAAQVFATLEEKELVFGQPEITVDMVSFSLYMTDSLGETAQVSQWFVGSESHDEIIAKVMETVEIFTK